MDIAAFRLAFPEFTSTTVYPDSQITFWATLAESQVLIYRWGSIWTQGVQLYVAHEITLAAQNKRISSFDGMPGTSGGVPNTKTVDAVTVGYDSNVTSEKDAGHWNLTNYGKQFIHLARIVGIGAVQL